MPSDRPAGPTPDQPTPDPAESQRTPRDPATPPYEHHPLPPYPEDDPAASGFEHHPVPPYPGDEPTQAPGGDPTLRFAAGAEPTIRIDTGGTPEPTPDLPGTPASGLPGGSEPTLSLPAESGFGAGESGSGQPGGFQPTLAMSSEFGSGAGGPVEGGAGGYQPTLPLPADFGQEQGGEHHAPHRLAGESHGGPGAFGEPAAAAPPTPGEGGFVLAGPSPYPVEPPPGLVGVPPVRAPRRGSMTTQEEGVTQPRPPTVAEARAREKARRRAEEQARAEEEAAEAKRRKKKRVLIGGAAVVGIAALVGGGYLVANAWNGPSVTAYCTVVAKNGEVVPTGPGQSVTATQDNQEIVVPDNYCSDASDRGDSGIHPGFFFLAGHSYRYYYGGTGSIGHAPSGGSISAPSGATVKTKSGSTIQRGGLGAKLHGKGGS